MESGNSYAGNMPPPPPPLPDDNVSVENGRYNPEPRGTLPSYVTGLNIVNTVTNLLLGAVALMAIMYANFLTNLNSQGSLSQHIYLCVIGYIIMMSQAILTISPFNSWTQTMKYQQKRTAHWIMQIIGASLAIAGSAIRIADRESNFTTVHGILGLMALIMTICSLIGGLINLLMTRMQIKQNLIKIFHSCIGVLTISMAFITLAFGFDHDAYRSVQGDLNAVLAIIFTGLALLGVIFSAFINMFYKIFGR